MHHRVGDLTIGIKRFLHVRVYRVRLALGISDENVPSLREGFQRMLSEFDSFGEIRETFEYIRGDLVEPFASSVGRSPQILQVDLDVTVTHRRGVSDLRLAAAENVVRGLGHVRKGLGVSGSLVITPGVGSVNDAQDQETYQGNRDGQQKLGSHRQVF